MGTTAQVEFTAEELLADVDVVEPLFAGHGPAAVRCHGGFDADGAYVSPRTKHRVPAISAWRARHEELFGRPVADVPIETWPATYPNVAQARFLLRSGVPEPLIATLTRIGTVEGYGANIRLLRPENLQRFFVEDIRGTAIDHLGRGLFEAHGRDEAGWEPEPGRQEAGHKDMWFAARDVAFEHPAHIDVDAMLARMGFGQQGAAVGEIRRLLPDDIDADLELMVGVMIRVLFIEVSAFHTFGWAEAWLSDADLVAGEGEAARLVSYIRADETPHVGYLTTAVAELRERTWLGTGGAEHDGAALVDTLWRHHLDQSLGAGRAVSRQAVLGEVEHWCAQRRNGADILAEFHALADTDADAA
jgi:hypothetical protein